ncbi:MAG: hypothetical protein AAB390_04955 [Patescibacteria group bacterium]
MKLPKFLTRNKQKNTANTFAGFFLNATEMEMKKVINEAARRANDDQRSLVEKINRLERKTP